MIPPSNEEISFVFARHHFAYRHILSSVKNCVVADIGCGAGYGCKLLSEQARLICGIDYDFNAVRYSKNNFNGPNICYVQMNAVALGLQRVFDVAVSFQVIEHMVDVHDFVAQLKKIVKPGGTIFISTPNVLGAKPSRGNAGNRFHRNEMDYYEFRDLMMKKFSSCNIFGVSYELDNRFRDLIQKLPFYHWGTFLKRTSKIKKLINHTLDLTKFRITDTDLAKSMDLLAICQND